MHFCRTGDRAPLNAVTEYYDRDGNRLDLCNGDFIRAEDGELDRQNKWYAEITKRLYRSILESAWQTALDD